MNELDAFLARLRIGVGATIGDHRIASAAIRRGRVEIDLEGFTVHISPHDPKAAAFARTASFDLSYVPGKSDPIPVMKALVDRIAANDPGGLELPPETRDAPKPEAPLPNEPRDFIFVDVDAKDLGPYSDAMHAMFDRRLDVMIIRNVFAPEQMAAIAKELERKDNGLAWLDNTQSDERDHLQPYNFGQVLIPTRMHPKGAPLDEYFARAATFRKTCRELFAGADFETRVEEILRAVSGGRPVSIPRGPNGESYTPATIRAIPPRAELAVHVGNYFKDSDSYWHLRTFVELGDQLSYFVPLATPEDGGELEVYSLEWHHRPRTPKGDLDIDAIARSPSTKYRPGAGDMFLFDGGRYYHRVCRIGGSKTRWTIGGFVTISKEHSEYFYWS